MANTSALQAEDKGSIPFPGSKLKCFGSIMASTSPCQGENTGSIPVRDSMYGFEEEQQTYLPVTQGIAGAAPVGPAR